MKKEQSLKLWGFILLLGLVFVVNYVFFNVGVSIYQHRCEQIEQNIQTLIYKSDSIEKVINTTLRERRDTVLIQICPQEIKFYCNKNTK